MRLIDADTLLNKLDSICVEKMNSAHPCYICTLCPLSDMVDVIDDAPTIDNIYGYSVNDLLMFAFACRKQGITEEHLHDFVLNVQSAYDIVSKEFENIMHECIGRMMTHETN